MKVSLYFIFLIVFASPQAFAEKRLKDDLFPDLVYITDAKIKSADLEDIKDTIAIKTMLDTFNHYSSIGFGTQNALEYGIQKYRAKRASLDGELSSTQNALVDTLTSVTSKTFYVGPRNLSDMGLGPLVDLGGTAIKSYMKGGENKKFQSAFYKSYQNRENLGDILLGYRKFIDTVNAEVSKNKDYVVSDKVRIFFKKQFGFDIYDGAEDRKNLNPILKAHYKSEEERRRFLKLSGDNEKLLKGQESIGLDIKAILEGGDLRGLKLDELQKIMIGLIKYQKDQHAAETAQAKKEKDLRAEARRIAESIKKEQERLKKTNAEYSQMFSSFENISFALARLPSLDKGTARTLNQAGSYFKFVGSVNKRLNQVGLSLFNAKKAELSKIDSLSLSVDVFAMGLNLAMSLMNTGPSIEESILKAVQELFEFMVDFREEVSQEFEGVNRKIRVLYQELEELSKKQDYNLFIISSKIEELRKAQLEIAEELKKSLKKEDYFYFESKYQVDTAILIDSFRVKNKSFFNFHREDLSLVKHFTQLFQNLLHAPMQSSAGKTEGAKSIWENLKSGSNANTQTKIKRLADIMSNRSQDLALSKGLVTTKDRVSLNESNKALIKYLTEPSFNFNSYKDTIPLSSIAEAPKNLIQTPDFHIGSWYDALITLKDELNSKPKILKNIQKDARKILSHIVKSQSEIAFLKLGFKDSTSEPLKSLSSSLISKLEAPFVAVTEWKNDVYNPLAYLSQFPKNKKDIKVENPLYYYYNKIKSRNFNFFSEKLKDPRSYINNIRPQALLASKIDIERIKNQFREWLDSHKSLPLCTPKLYSRNKTMHLPKTIYGEEVWTPSLKDKVYREIVEDPKKLNFILAYHAGILPELSLCAGVVARQAKNYYTEKMIFHGLQMDQVSDFFGLETSVSLISKNYSLMTWTKKQGFYAYKKFSDAQGMLGNKGHAPFEIGYRFFALDENIRTPFFEGYYGDQVQNNFRSGLQRYEDVDTSAYYLSGYPKAAAYLTRQKTFLRELDFSKLTQMPRPSSDKTQYLSLDWSLNGNSFYEFAFEGKKEPSENSTVYNGLVGFFQNHRDYGQQQKGYKRGYPAIEKGKEYSIAGDSIFYPHELTNYFIENQVKDEEPLKTFFDEVVVQSLEEESFKSFHATMQPSRISAAFYYSDLRKKILKDPRFIFDPQFEVDSHKVLERKGEDYSQSALMAYSLFGSPKPPFIQSRLETELEDVIQLIRKSYGFWVTQCEKAAELGQACANYVNENRKEHSVYFDQSSEKRADLLKRQTMDGVKQDLYLLGAYRLAFSETLRRDANLKKEWAEAIDSTVVHLENYKGYKLFEPKKLYTESAIKTPSTNRAIVARKVKDNLYYPNTVTLMTKFLSGLITDLAAPEEAQPFKEVYSWPNLMKTNQELETLLKTH